LDLINDGQAYNGAPLLDYVAVDDSNLFSENKTFHTHKVMFEQLGDFMFASLFYAAPNSTDDTAEGLNYAFDSFYNGGSPPIVFERMANGMTYARRNGTDPIIEYGSVLKDQTFVSVQYAWLVPLAMLLVLMGVRTPCSHSTPYTSSRPASMEIEYHVYVVFTWDGKERERVSCVDRAGKRTEG